MSSGFDDLLRLKRCSAPDAAEATSRNCRRRQTRIRAVYSQSRGIFRWRGASLGAYPKKARAVRRWPSSDHSWIKSKPAYQISNNRRASVLEIHAARGHMKGYQAGKPASMDIQRTVQNQRGGPIRKWQRWSAYAARQRAATRAAVCVMVTIAATISTVFIGLPWRRSSQTALSRPVRR